MPGDWIDLDFFLATIKDATRDQASVAWVGWLAGAVAVALGAVPPVHPILLGFGAVLLVAMAVHLGLKVRDRRDSARIARRPPAPPSPRGEAREEVRLHLDVPERPDPPPAG